MSARAILPPASLALASLVLAGSLLGAAPAAPATPDAGGTPVFDAPPAGAPNFTGKWLALHPARKLVTLQGAAPPLNVAGKAQYAKRQAALQAGDRSIDPIGDCKMQGVPRLMYAPYPMLILQFGKHVDFIHQVNHTFRIVRLDRPPPEDPDPNWLGQSQGHWQGQTLVIDSFAFNDETWLDYSGLPHSDKLKVQERYRLKDAWTLEGRITIDDPVYYDRPWTVGLTLKKQPGLALQPGVCEEDHRM